MGRPEPCVLFAQTFVQPQLDEYVDEVLFPEPVVVTACEFLEQNAASACSSLKLVGATSPPSFALEVFVQCEGETRFRRLCQPFLYSHSSSNVLEVERENMVLCLTLDLLVSLARESCYHFVNCGGMEQLGYCFVSSLQNSSALKLLHLGVIEQATSHSVGCEGFLGWWPREDENIPSGTSERYNQLLKLLLHNLRHDVASLATYILHRLRFYEVSSRYECSILSVLGGLSGSGQATSATMDILANAKLQLKNFLILLWWLVQVNLWFLVMLDNYSTSHLITQSSCCFSNNDMDQHLLSLLKALGGGFVS
uniref:Uncharacterized protein isoform X3 n=1 Tax=Nicotiana tabacum TaxID=4097 RepID=A0A1S4BD79_TOBAC|nr:PREDICTED: uncharacterized protein LOC107807102 isoform X3 [Nicotiana tabacum]